MGAEIEALNKQNPLQEKIEGVLVNHLLFVLYVVLKGVPKKYVSEIPL